MLQDEQSFLQRLLATFKVEAAEHLKAMSDLLLQLEKSEAGPARAELIETLFREAHSLKGASRSVNQSELESYCQTLESTLAPLKRGEIELTGALFEQLYRMVDQLALLLARGLGSPEAAALDEAPMPEPAPAPAPVPPPPAAVPLPVSSETVRISTAKLGTLLNQVEELLAFKFSSAHLLGELTVLSREFSIWKKDWTRITREMRAFRRGLERQKQGSQRERRSQPLLDKVLDVMERDELKIKLLETRLNRLTRTCEQDRHVMNSMVDGLLDDIKQTLMLPFASLLELFPKLVRDQAKNSGKQVELKMEGGAIEIDRRILEQMKDPLIHLLRNGIDHGVEAPAERSARGKPATAVISIRISPKDGNKIELAVADDGAGIRLARVRETAEKQGLLVPGEAVPEAALYQMLFESGFSTSPIITDISGRGLGLAIVREKVEKLGGRIELESQEFAGTRFCITLPTTLATFRGLLVALGDRHFVLPSASVERALRVAPAGIRTVENRETIELAGEVVALVWLADVLELARAPAHEPDPYLHVVVLAAAGRRIAFAVDEVIADQEVLVKHLGPQLPRVRNVAAATVLGAGRVVPILNVSDLLKSAVALQPAPRHAEASAAPAGQSLLVVEDSITSRSLLKSILEASGYRVSTAVDGVEALNALRSGRFDLVVSDVEMPRMDGFDLTAKIRQEARLKELPVVLVTALSSPEDKARGIDVGADAYIVKSSFDQSNLLEVIRRLI